MNALHITSLIFKKMNKENVAIRGYYIFIGVIGGMIIEGLINNQVLMKLLELAIHNK